MQKLDKDTLKLSSGAWSGAFIEAVEAVGRGWSVVPWRIVKSDGKASKPPDSALIRKATGSDSWAQFRDRRPTRAELNCWRGADYFAVVPGETSNVLVLDVDPGADLSGLHLPETAIAKTSREGGWHYYFAYPRGIPYRQTPNILPKIDLPAVAILPNGRERRWHISPKDVPLAHAPEWLVDKLRKSGKSGKPLLDLTPPRSRDIPTRDPNEELPTELAALLPLRGDRLSKWFENEQACCQMVAKLMEKAGIQGNPPSRLGQSFHDVLPGKPDNNPSATLVRNRDGRIVYKSHRRPAEDSVFAMPDVMASLFTGNVGKIAYTDKEGRLRGLPSTALWSLRLLWEAFDHIKLPDVPYRALPACLPPEAPNAVRAVYDGFLLLAQLRELHTPGEPFTYSRSFAASWCQVGERQAGAAIQWLYRDYMDQVGKYQWYTLLRPATGEKQDYETQDRFVSVGDVVSGMALKMTRGSNALAVVRGVESEAAAGDITIDVPQGELKLDE